MTVTLSGINQGANVSTLPVTQGGTGVATITGIVKGTGTAALVPAVPGTDYQVPLVSGTHVKTLGGVSLVGSGDVAIAGLGGTTITGNVTLTVSSAGSMQVTPTAPGLYATLPVATTCSKSAVLFSIYNNGDYDYGVKDSAGTQLGWVRPRTGAIIGLADNSTAAGTWAPYGLEKTGITASYVNSTATNTSSTIRRIALDADRTCFLFGGTTCYAIVYDASTQTWGTATSVRTSIASGAFIGVLAATDKVLVCSNDSTTGMETVTLTISTNTITVNTGTKATTVLAGSWTSYGQLIAVGSSFVIGYNRAATVASLRAITVSGTTPTVGAESTPSGNQAIYLFASGSVVRTLGYNGSFIYATPYTVSGSTLTVGTAASVALTVVGLRAFLNGNGNIVCHYINTTHYATIFKLTGTTEAASSVSLGTVPSDVTNHADYVQVTASKTAFIADASSTTWYANVLTDTAGTASAGTEISGAHPMLSYGVAGIAASGNNARFCLAGSSAIGQLTLDCSGTSPVFADQSSAVVGTGAISYYRASSNYGVRNGQTLLADTTGYSISGSGSTFYDMRFTPGKVTRSASILPPTGSTFISGASNESFCIGVANSTIGAFITRIEAAA